MRFWNCACLFNAPRRRFEQTPILLDLEPAYTIPIVRSYVVLRSFVAINSGTPTPRCT